MSVNFGTIYLDADLTSQATLADQNGVVGCRYIKRAISLWNVSQPDPIYKLKTGPVEKIPYTMITLEQMEKALAEAGLLQKEQDRAREAKAEIMNFYEIPNYSI